MFKRNPDAIALALIVCFMVGSAAAPWKRMQRTSEARMVRMAERQEMKMRLRHSVASLKQCFRPIVIRHKPIQRSL